MAIIRIAEPASVNPVTDDWQSLLNKLTLTTGAFLEVAFVDDGTNPPKIKLGSRFEVNASFFMVTEDEEIPGYASIPANAERYIYAIPNQPNPGEASFVTFSYDATVPVYDPALGGLFNGINRAIGFLNKTPNLDPAVHPKIWAIGPVPSQNVKITSQWQCPTPPLPGEGSGGIINPFTVLMGRGPAPAGNTTTPAYWRALGPGVYDMTGAGVTNTPQGGGIALVFSTGNNNDLGILFINKGNSSAWIGAVGYSSFFGWNSIT